MVYLQVIVKMQLDVQSKAIYFIQLWQAMQCVMQHIICTSSWTSIYDGALYPIDALQNTVENLFAYSRLIPNKNIE